MSFSAAAVVRLKGSLRHRNKFPRAMKRPSVTARPNDVKQALTRLDAPKNRVLAFKAFEQLQLGHYG